ncbi:hypothetical protein [uncultured Alistipes sp.]|uniref:hypothetical protein n=1 Tax=uncultured Alistipes sp. TaxID=538949 RepID=UPI00272F1C95|nr:hypothetical protein [uncultured Alistipes sp.]
MPASSIHKYRLTSTEEPTDEMLAQIMESACAEATKRAAEAERTYFAELSELVEETCRSWEKRGTAQTE